MVNPSSEVVVCLRLVSALKTLLRCLSRRAVPSVRLHFFCFRRRVFGVRFKWQSETTATHYARPPSSLASHTRERTTAENLWDLRGLAETATPAFPVRCRGAETRLSEDEPRRSGHCTHWAEPVADRYFHAADFGGYVRCLRSSGIARGRGRGAWTQIHPDKRVQGATEEL